ncbi:phosphotransferase [Erythrobacter sp. SCSIO 43205]|uniref:ecdysteroid 22-kinase family protein n=1 Tax=Erythrobacter sp. SCSIO 43205 TaxID=2779361 RepID=UPI001CA8FC46|nr:ecdysteroid 22-kinase family protein [Erythrobacter sp. SCSIO 43205]UAB77501.1 phosphotransferase [Erythrobacter sp. SCSIO 43205]
MRGFPVHPDQVTPDWLNTVVTGSDAGQHGAVTAVAWSPIGTGQVGDSVRFDLTHEGGGTSTLAAKFAAEDETSRTTAKMMRLYEKEVRFYREIAPHLSARVPQTYACEVSEDGGEFILLFEDLGPARGGNQIAGCTIEDARQGIRQAAAIHASTWGRGELIGKEWLKAPEPVIAQLNAMYPHAQATFRERYANVLEPEYMELCERYAPYFAALGEYFKPAQCLVHGDFRLDNMLFDIKGGAEPIAILDWQTVASGRGMSDVAYFLGTGIGNDLRRAHEDELLQLYLDEMNARGVSLTREDIWLDYRIGALSGLSTGVFSAAFVERTQRGDANFLSMVRGACGLALDHGSLDALLEVQK